MDYVRMCSKSIPIKSKEWLKHIDAVYTKTTFSEIFLSQYCRFSKDLPVEEEAIEEITNYVVNTNFFQNYKLEDVFAVVLLYRGFPLFTIQYLEAKKNPQNFLKYLIIDVDNYKFNKTIEKKVKEYANRRFWTYVYEGIFVVSVTVVLVSGYYLLTRS